MRKRLIELKLEGSYKDLLEFYPELFEFSGNQEIIDFHGRKFTFVSALGKKSFLDDFENDQVYVVSFNEIIKVQPKFKEGDKVFKLNGYRFIGTVRSVFTNGNSEWRVVVENGDGLLHIFNESQLNLDPVRTK